MGRLLESTGIFRKQGGFLWLEHEAHGTGVVGARREAGGWPGWEAWAIAAAQAASGSRKAKVKGAGCLPC